MLRARLLEIKMDKGWEIENEECPFKKSVAKLVFDAISIAKDSGSITFPRDPEAIELFKAPFQFYAGPRTCFDGYFPEIDSERMRIFQETLALNRKIEQINKKLEESWKEANKILCSMLNEFGIERRMAHFRITGDTERYYVYGSKLRYTEEEKKKRKR